MERVGLRYFSFDFDNLFSATAIPDAPNSLYRYLLFSGSTYSVTIGAQTFSFDNYES
jgi:hypothetical protein